VFRGRGVLVVRGQADAPDLVEWRCLNQHPATGGEQEVAQFWVLAELREVASYDYVEALLFPELLIEPPHLAA